MSLARIYFETIAHGLKYKFDCLQLSINKQIIEKIFLKLTVYEGSYEFYSIDNLFRHL